MKTLLCFLAFFGVLEGNAQNYYIRFEGKGVPVNTVIVKNLATWESITLKGTDILYLRGNMDPTDIKENRSLSGIKIYPNPMKDNSTIEIYAPKSGNATISIVDISGKLIMQIQSYLEDYKQEFRLAGEGKGLYIIWIRGNGYQLSEKLLCTGSIEGKLNIEKISTNQIIDKKATKNDTKGTQGIVEMLYLPGNKLKLTAISGNLRTILTDIPNQDKTIVFHLEACADPDKNNYHLVEIGNQIWLEENLKTTKYNDFGNIPYSWPLDSTNNDWNYPTTPGYAWYNDSIKYKEPDGALYNWLAVDKGNLCPVGWHVPTVDEWNTLRDYLTINENVFEDGSSDVAKSIASTSGWKIPEPFDNRGNIIPVIEGNVGKNQATNNNTGFNAYPSGLRHFYGFFAYKGFASIWWSATGPDNPWDFSIVQEGYNGGANIYQGSDYKRNGFSVRCIKD